MYIAYDKCDVISTSRSEVLLGSVLCENWFTAF